MRSKPFVARGLLALVLIAAVTLGTGSLAFGQGGGSQFTPATITNDQGGAVHITGKVTYTNVFFTAGVAEPLIITEDEAGFVDRDRGFLLPLASQTLGQITSDFFTSPFTYSIALPEVPQGSLRDVDQNKNKDTGVQVFAIAYWTNTFGDTFLEKRDLGGGGWSNDYASTKVSANEANYNEIVGGKLLIYAPDDKQGFPSGFGADGKLFTADDPIVGLPAGYTVVDLDTNPFTFDRSKEQELDLNENPSTVLQDFSQMTYTQAFDAMIDLMRREYAFTDLKKIDWDQKIKDFRPRFEKAEADKSSQEYLVALRDFAWSIPDKHIGGPFIQDLFTQETQGGLGMAIRDLDDGRVIVNFVLDGGPAAQAGIQIKAEIVSINGQPVNDFVNANVPWSSPFSTETDKRLQQLRYAIRFPLDTKVEVSYKNPGDTTATTVTLTAVKESADLAFSSARAGITGTELPVEFKILDSGYGYVKIFSFFDNERLTAELWERAIQTMNDNQVPGLIIDMRQNNGGNGFLADQMAGYFFDDTVDIGNTEQYAKDVNAFFSNPQTEQYIYTPTQNLRYHGKIAMLVGPACISACEFFAYDMTLQQRATVVGMYPTAGGGGSVNQFAMPEGEFFQFPVGRTIDKQGKIIIEGVGIVPDVKVPVTLDTLFSPTDPILDAGVATLDKLTGSK